MAIEQFLKLKTTQEKSLIKSQEISKYKHSGIFDNIAHGVRVEIVGDVTPITVNGQNGIQVFARAWKNGKQLGFGSDGSVEIERFRIFNPPILVDDVSGIIVRNNKDIYGNVITRTLREDPIEALRQSLLRIVPTVGKENTTIIIGSIGNTTDTYYSNTGGDGRAYRDLGAGVTWASIRDGAGNGSDSAGTTEYIMCDSGNDASTPNSSWRIAVMFLPFDTSALTTGQQVDSATLGFTTVTAVNTAGDDTLYGIATAQASGTALANSDYETRIFTAITSNGVSTADATGAKTLTITDLTKINRTGYSKLGLTFNNDIANTPPTASLGQTYIQIYTADQTGTSSDPILTVVHTTAASNTGAFFAMM